MIVLADKLQEIEMEKFKGTPGPWFVSDNHSEVNEKLSDKGYHFISTESGFYSDEHDSGFEIAGCISIADANLIAAAPDLLEALQDIVRSSQAFHSALEFDHEFDGVALYDNAVKAIARALGKNDGEE